MDNKIIIFFVLIILISSGMFFVYYKYEKPNQGINSIWTNLSISAELDNKNIVTGYRINKDSFFFSEGQTLEDGSILKRIPINGSYEIVSVNLENQSYYQISKIINVNEFKNYRVILDLLPPGTISISHNIEKTNNRVLVKITSDGVYNKLMYCLDWSSNFIWVKNSNDTLNDNIIIDKYVKCYETRKSLEDNNYNLILDYKEWDTLNNDSIKLFIFDTKLENDEIIYKDFGGKDLEYTISGF